VGGVRANFRRPVFVVILTICEDFAHEPHRYN